jgi:translation elongation factor EF-Tu-like GTPase
MATNDLIIVKAKITMKTTEEGGRQSGFKSGYKPNHVFDLPIDLKNLKTYIGDIQFDDQELIAPGETKIVTVRFLKIMEVEKYITVGRKWLINEAAKTVGFGEILET